MNINQLSAFIGRLFLVSVFSMSVFAQGPAITLADGQVAGQSIARILERGELRVAMHATDQVPFFYRRDGTTQGTDVELAQGIAEALGVELRLIRTENSFDGVVDQAVFGAVDLSISKISRTLSRSKRVSFSVPYATFRQAFLVNRVEFARIEAGRSLRDVFLDFDGKIGVIARSSFAAFARQNFPAATIVEYPTYQDVVDAVIEGNVVAGYRDEFEVKKVLQSDPSLSLTLRTVTFDDLVDTIGIVVPLESPTLLAFVNMFLEQKYRPLRIEYLLELTKEIQR